MTTIKCRIYPTIHQEAKLSRTLDTCRWLYNYLIDKNIQSREDMQFILTELKLQEPWLTQFHSKMLQMVIHKIDSSRRALKALQRNGHKTGKLHFIKHDEYNTFTYNQSGFKIERHGNTDMLWLSKIGCTEIRLHRPVDCEIIQVTITRKAGSWYASLIVKKQWQLPEMINFRNSVGIDVGIRNYVYDSDGYTTPNPENLKKLLEPLVRAGRKLSRRVYNSQNYKKAKRHYQIIQDRIARRRKDFLHKLSIHYSSRYDVIVLEKLQIPNMIRNHHLSQSIGDAAWGAFKEMIGYKSKIMVEVEPYHTTIECSRCGHLVPKTLAIRTHICDQCGLTLDRDHNSARTIHDRGLALLGLPMVHREVTPVEILMGSRKQEKPIALRHG